MHILYCSIVICFRYFVIVIIDDTDKKVTCEEKLRFDHLCERNEN